MNYIEEFCDSIAILNGGENVLTGELHDIKRNYPRNKLVVNLEDKDKLISEMSSCSALQEDGSVLLTLSSPDEKRIMMKRLIENYDIDGIKVYEPTLNDIFVEYADDQR